MPDWLRSKLAAVLDLDSSDVYEVDGMINIRDLAPLLKIDRLDPILKKMRHLIQDLILI